MAETITKLCKGCGQIKQAWKTRSTYCTDCCKQHNRDWSAKHVDKVKARDRRRNAAPERKQQISTHRKLRRRHDPEFREREILSTRARQMLVKYGITVEQYAAMRDAQHDCCAICGRYSSNWSRMGRKVDLAVDHDHDTNKLRELLCGYCNTALGSFMDSPLLLLRAMEYLLKHGKPWTG